MARLQRQSSTSSRWPRVVFVVAVNDAICYMLWVDGFVRMCVHHHSPLVSYIFKLPSLLRGSVYSVEYRWVLLVRMVVRRTLSTSLLRLAIIRAQHILPIHSLRICTGLEPWPGGVDFIHAAHHSPISNSERTPLFASAPSRVDVKNTSWNESQCTCVCEWICVSFCMEIWAFRIIRQYRAEQR